MDLSKLSSAIQAVEQIDEKLSAILDQLLSDDSFWQGDLANLKNSAQRLNAILKFVDPLLKSIPTATKADGVKLFSVLETIRQIVQPSP